MTNKEYMRQILRIDDRIESIKRDIEAQIERKADTLSATDYSKDRISGGTCSDISSIVVSIEQCVEQQRREIERLNAIKAEVKWVIGQVKQNDLAMILTERYVRDKSWKEIAETLRYSEARVRGALHDRALVEVGYIRSII